MKARHTRFHRPAFTLAELVVSMAITTIVLGGSISAILIASHALPGPEAPSEVTLKTSTVAGDIAEELAYALHFTERTATSVAFTVADRDADGLPERIRYEWSGAADASGPLTRQYNDEDPVEVLADVRRFDLGYEIEALAEVYAGAGVKSSEAVLSSYDAAVDVEYRTIEKTKWLGQYFQPTLPANAFSWSPTQVWFRAMAEGTRIELTYVQLRTVGSSNTPTTTVLQQREMPETMLSSFSYDWVGFAYDSVRGISPGRGLCVVWKHSGSGAASAKMYNEKSRGSGFVRTDDSGASWSYYSSRTMRYYIYGTVTTAGPDQTVIRHYVTNVGLALEAGDDNSAPVETSIPILNTPEVLSDKWELDFDADPTAVDVNGDGVGDWVLRGGGSFDPATLVGGVWQANGTLDTFPDNDFTGLTTVELRFRNTSIGGMGAVFCINLDRSGDTFGVVYASLMLQADGTQVLIIYTKTDNSTSVPLRTITGLPNSFVRLRLVLDPATDSVSITVNGSHKGTYNYTRFSAVNNERFATILAFGSNAEFDEVSVRVAGSH